jgi:hypothetical protein
MTLKGIQCSKNALSGGLCSTHMKHCGSRISAVQRPVQRPQPPLYPAPPPPLPPRQKVQRPVEHMVIPKLPLPPPPRPRQRTDKSIQDLDELAIENICQELVKQGDFKTLSKFVLSNKKFGICQKFLDANKKTFDHMLMEKVCEYVGPIGGSVHFRIEDPNKEFWTLYEVKFHVDGSIRIVKDNSPLHPKMENPRILPSDMKDFYRMVDHGLHISYIGHWDIARVGHRSRFNSLNIDLDKRTYRLEHPRGEMYKEIVDFLKLYGFKRLGRFD